MIYFAIRGTVIMCTRFRVSSSVFRRLVREIGQRKYFAQRRNKAGRLWATPEQKITLALRMLAYGTPADAHDEYLRLSESVGSKHNTIRSITMFVLRSY